MYSHRKYKRFHSKRAFQSYRYPTIKIKDILLLVYTKVKKSDLPPRDEVDTLLGLLNSYESVFCSPLTVNFRPFEYGRGDKQDESVKTVRSSGFFLMLTIQTNLDLHNFHFCKKKTSFKKSYLFPLFVVKYQIHYIYLPHSVFQKSLYSE